MNVLDLGLISYADALDAQLDVLLKRICGETEDTLIICEHYPVITLGRFKDPESVKDAKYFSERGIDVLESGRGGKITYHAPGQVVVYPVIDLKDSGMDVSGYIDSLESTVAAILKEFGISAERNRERRGVWVAQNKIAFIGVAFKKWVTYHGVSININNDLEPFKKIDPCGEGDIKVTSAREVLGRELNIDEVKRIVAEKFSWKFDCRKLPAEIAK